MLRFSSVHARSNRLMIGLAMLLVAVGMTQTASPARGADDSAALNRTLDRALPSVQFNMTNFPDAIDFMRDLTGINIVVDDAAIKAAAIDLNPVTFSKKDVKVTDVLKGILESEGNGKLGFAVEDDVVMISTAE